MQIDGETVETLTDFILWALKSLQMVTAAMKLKTLLGKKVMTNLDSLLKSRDINLPTYWYLLCSQSYGFSSSHVWM